MEILITILVLLFFIQFAVFYIYAKKVVIINQRSELFRKFLEIGEICKRLNNNYNHIYFLEDKLKQQLWDAKELYKKYKKICTKEEKEILLVTIQTAELMLSLKNKLKA